MTILQELVRELQVAERRNTRTGAKVGWGGVTANPGAYDTIYGTGLFNLCGDNDVISTLVEDDNLLRWLQWLPNNERTRFVKMLTWRGPDGSSWDVLTPTVGYLAADCDEPNSVEWGKCETSMTKGLYGRCGQDIAMVNIGYKYCDKEPIYRIDGSVINNDAEWQVALASAVLKNDISQHLITGDASVTNQFNGLENLIKTGYVDVQTGEPCSQVDSIIYDWANQPIAGLAAVLAEIIARIKLRARSAGGVNVSQDITIMLPSFLRDCLVAEFACSGPCASGDGSTVMVIQADATSNRDRYLVGGANGDGWIPINGEPVSFLINDWIPFQSCPGGGAGSYVSDIYVLTRRIGNRTVLRGEFQDFSDGAAAMARAMGSNVVRVTDGGRFVVYSKMDELCFNTCLVTRPGIYLSAPWVQARITDVCCSTNLAPLSPDSASEYLLDWDELYPAANPGFVPNRPG